MRAVQARDASVTAASVRRLLQDVARTSAMLASIADHLKNHPSALTDGGSRMPKVVAEFIYHLIEHGVTGLVAPSCAVCGRPRTLFHNYEDGQRICTSCYNRSRREACSSCGRENLSVAKRGSDGRAICGTCSHKDKPKEACAGCGRVMAVRRGSDGLQYCRGCQGRRAPKEECVGCGRTRRVNARDRAGAAMCTTCYTKLRQTRGLCAECGETTVLVVREGGRGGHKKSLCVRCYRHPERECGLCGRTRRIALRATETSPDVCPTCYWAPVVECSECGQQGLGRRTTRNGQPWCFACQAARRINALLVDVHGTIRPGFEGVRDALAQVDPRSVLANWGRTESLTLLAKMLEQHNGVTHELLDEQGSRTGVHYLRALLVSTGVLEERDEHMSRLRNFCQEYVAEVEDVEMRHVLSRYAQWHIVGGRRVGSSGLTSNQDYSARQSVRAARRFLDRLILRGQHLGECTQRDIDRWVLGAKTLTFVHWLKDQRLLAAELEVPERHIDAAVATNDPENHWTLARRLLHDSKSGGVEERVVGCLVLLYGQPLTRIVQLTRDDLIENEDKLQLRLGPEPLELVPPLADLMRQLPVHKPFGAARESADERWLFPGKSAGRPRHPTSLMRSLNRQGIPARTSRNTALYHLATTVPPAVIASLLGVHAITAQRWAQTAGANWLMYGNSRGVDQ